MQKLIKNILLLIAGIIFFSSILITQPLRNPVDITQSLKPIKLQLKYVHQFQFAGYYAALYKGFYTNAGFDVEIFEGKQQTDALNNVLAGTMDYGISDVDIIEARMLKKPIVLLASIFQHSHHILLAKKSSNIRKPSDLIGKRVMLQQDYVGMAQLSSIFFREGIDIKSIDIIKDRWSFNALVEDSVDVITAYITEQPYRLEVLGYEPQIIKAEDYGIDFYGDMLFTSEKNTIQNREEVIRFRQATIDGWEYAVTHEDEIIEYILNETDAAKRITFDRLKYEAKKIKELVLYGYVDVGNINPSRIDKMAKVIFESGKVAPQGEYSLDLEGFIFDPNPSNNKHIPKIIFTLISISAIIIILAITIVYYFRKKVKERTSELSNEIKQRKLFEETLTISEQRYKSLFENSPLSLIEVDFSELFEFLNKLKANINEDLSKFLNENPSIAESCHHKIKVTGINKKGRSFLNVENMHINDYINSFIFKTTSKEKFIEHILAIISGKFFTEQEITLVLHNNEEKEVIARSSSYDNDCKKALTSFIDITERKKMEHILSEREKSFKTLSYEFQTILNSMPDAIIVLDSDRKVTWMNNRASNPDIFGGIIKDKMFCCTSLLKEEFYCDICTVREAAYSKVPKAKEFVSQGGKVWEFRYMPLLDENNNVVSIIIMIRDNTIKKRIEEEVFKKEKIASVGILAAGIAHDFNNLLTAILGNISLSKMLAIKENNAKVVQSLESAEKAAIRAKDLSFQLLTFSKGGDPIKKQTSLQDIIQESANFILRGSKNKLEVIIPDDIWTVEVDPGQIGQVIQNLVLNADQATVKPGTITISCNNVIIDEHNRVNLNIQDGNYVRVAVKDEGVGIPEELKNKIFDPYFSTKSVGNGLGLTTCYNIIEKHQGDLKFSSVLNKGAEFYFYLPVDKHIELTKENKTSDDRKVAIGNGKIMVVDDEEMVRDLVFDILTGLGYRVECFPEGASAISKYKEVLESDPFDIVITDLTIPGGVGGKEVVSSILKINPKAKIIVSSGYSNDPMMAEHVKYGFTGVIPKPYDVEALSKVIANTMQHQN